jgi:sugar/nucleoside kinase (ribokinase family)
VISKDKDGAYALDGGAFYRCPAPKCKIVDATGAGDSFTGALAFEYQRSGDIARALSVGTAAAEIKLGHMGPRIDLPAEKFQKLVARNFGKFPARKVGPDSI